MQLTFDIPEKDLVEFGKETIQQEIQKMIKWLKIKQSFIKISDALKVIDKKSYFSKLEKIRESTWDEYKKELDIRDHKKSAKYSSILCAELTQVQ